MLVCIFAGANWGKLGVDNYRILFEDREGNTIFDLPISTISQAVAQGKGDIAVEFPQDDDVKSNMAQLESLCEVRFWAPNDEREEELEQLRQQKLDQKSVKMEGADEEKKDGAEGEEGEEEGEEEVEEETAAQLIVRDIMSHVGGDDRAVQPIVHFEVMFQSPRGKYNIDMYANYLKLHSKTFQYKIQYKFIQKMFLFACPPAKQWFFVIGLNPPVRQGRTAYPYLLVAFSHDFEKKDGEDAESKVERYNLNIDEKTCAEKYHNIIEPQMGGHEYDVVTRCFKALTEKKVMTPGNGFMSAANKGPMVRCNYKANDGWLYIMEKSFFYVKKPLYHIRHGDIVEIGFERISNSSSGSKSFDLRIVTNEEKNNEYTFAGIK